MTSNPQDNGLSAENRALIDYNLAELYETGPGAGDWVFTNAALSALLNAAREEARSTPSERGVSALDRAEANETIWSDIADERAARIVRLEAALLRARPYVVAQAADGYPPPMGVLATIDAALSSKTEDEGE